MLRVGLTGGLASGKSAVAAAFAEGGAHVFSADAIGRSLMQPGQPVFAAIAEHFGPAVLTPAGQLNRAMLARLAFEEGRLAELNALVHPAVFRAQDALLREVAEHDPQGIAVVESALIFEVAAGGDAAGTDWRRRFDRLVLVTAPEAQKISRYIARTVAAGGDAPAPDITPQELAAQARARLARQLPDADKIPVCDYVIENTGSLVLLRRRAHAVLASLRAEAAPR